MRKPSYQWETRAHRAERSREAPGGAWADDARAEAFALRFEGGRVGHATLGLARQQVDAASAEDPELPHAVRAWLAARGARAIDLVDDGGLPIAQGPFAIADLDTPATGEVRRLVTLAPSCAELVDAVACFERVIACEDSSDHPPEIERCERLGPDLGPDLDRIAALAPDLVVSSLSVPGMERIVSGLRARGVPQLVSAPRSLAEVLADLGRVGDALGVPDRAAVACERMEAERDALLADRGSPPVSVYLEWWPRPMFSPGRDCYSNELIALAGGKNVFGARPGASVEVTADDLLAADPDVCFVSWCGVAEDKLDPGNLCARAGLVDLRAVREGRVYPLDEQFSGRPGPRMLEAARRMRLAIRGE